MTDKVDREEKPSFCIPDLIDQFFLEKRKLILIGEIDDSASAYITMHLQLFAMSTDPVYLYISSDGGDPNAGYAIIDQMDLSPFPVYIIVRGRANSMAAIIAAHGKIGHRFITENSSMMIHSISIASHEYETIEKHKIAIDYYEKFNKFTVKELAKRTNIQYNALMDLMTQTHWMDAKEAIKLGFVDYMLTKEKEIESNQIKCDGKKSS